MFYHVLSEEEEGRRIDRVVKEWWPEVPLGARMKAFRTAAVRLDGKRVDCGARVSAGGRLQVPWPEPPVRTVQAVPEQKKDVQWVIYQDRNILVANKPAGLLTQPDRPGGDSLVSRVWELLGICAGQYRPSAAHRLDRNTSGAVMIPLNGVTLRQVAEEIRERLVTKEYLAIVEGAAPNDGVVDAPLLKEPGKNITVVSNRGQDARTEYTCLGRGGGCTVLSVRLVTGRPHQIRAHMSHIGHAVCGDVKYGPQNPRFSRPMLHAHKISITIDGKIYDFTAPPPEDFISASKQLNIKNLKFF